MSGNGIDRTGYKAPSNFNYCNTKVKRVTKNRRRAMAGGGERNHKLLCNEKKYIFSSRKRSKENS